MMKEIKELRIKLNRQIEHQLTEELVLSDADFVAEIMAAEKELEHLYNFK